MRAWFSAVVAMSGCVVTGSGTEDPGGQTGTAHPPGCVEDSRVAVEDLAVAPAGFTVALADLLAPIEGDWVGSTDLEGGGPADFAVAVAWDGGLVEAVLSHVEEGTGMEMGAPFGNCGPRYDLGLTLDVVATPYLDFGGAGHTSMFEDGALSLAVDIAEGETGGTLLPPEWENPQYWDRTLLSAEFQRGFDASTGMNLMWMAVNDDPASGGGNTTTTTGGGQVGTGWVEPSGMVAMIGYVTLARPL